MTNSCDCCCHLGNNALPGCDCAHCVRVRAGFGIEIAHLCQCSVQRVDDSVAVSA
jgi:hypothetical protein